MARPQKFTIDYFPHIVNGGKTMLILQNEFGNDGYAFWFKLLELLCNSDGQVFDYNNQASWRLLLAITLVSEDIVIKILQLLADLNAIDPELHREKIIWSQSLVENLELVYRRRSTGIPEKPVIVSNNPPSVGVSVNKSTQTKQYNTKQYNTKQHNTIIDSIFSLWNEQKIITHKQLSSDMIRAISKALNELSLEEISQAIRNYSEIINSDGLYWFSYRWTLKDFLARGLDKFRDLEVAKQNYRIDKKEAKNGEHRGISGNRPAGAFADLE